MTVAVIVCTWLASCAILINSDMASEYLIIISTIIQRHYVFVAGPTSHALKALLPEHGTIWKDRNGELLKTIKVYFFEKETKWRCGKDIIGPEMVVGMQW